MENPELLIGIPLVVLALFGLVAALGLFAVPAEETAGGPAVRPVRHAGEHPEPSEYVVIFLVLGFITALEVAAYYVDVAQGVLITFLVFASALKFAFVVAWFMHLRFDSKLYTVLFVGGLLLAFAVFAIVLSTLKAGLV